MQRLIKHIHSPAALFAFEAAARHLSFTHAANELNVTQPAVSQAVKRIEEALGVQLFQREHRALSLTEAGERFYDDVSYGLIHIRRSVERISTQRQDRHVTLSVTTAFANYWMVPRLGAFRESNPDVDLRVQTTNRDVDIASESISLAVRLGDGDWPGYQALPLAREEIYAVCSPSYLNNRQAPAIPADLLSHSLIHLEEPFRPRATWVDWFAQNGVAYRDAGEGLRLNDYALVIQTAIAGEGIAFGWRHVVELLIAQGVLVKALEASFRSDKRFFVVWPQAVALSPEAIRVRDWLASQASVDVKG
ncbi:MAG: LysR family transcriptional regulator [Rhizobiales bacterium]|nr:LysR family transcriptional regulator [Hyphomicrobiales bacterium]